MRDFRERPTSASDVAGAAIPTFPLEWSQVNGKAERIVLQARTNHQSGSLAADVRTRDGHCPLVHADVRLAVEHGILARVLPKLRFDSYPLTMLTARCDREPAKVRVTATALKDYFASLSQT
ncbi:hypothetical protein CH92_12795 [Stutzerimonas stutzeri]|uniref:LysR substrate-binding domain-containing protein n=1 Tax=Stutzerimonas stutzeri TaxID=316 RepID=W8RGK6_STUST|nr:hypothetical protein CH92_12795 [Stutzerimonas stutzeri]